MVRSFAHMTLGISNRNRVVLWPGCGCRAEFSLRTKNVRSVWFVVERRGCCCNLSGGVALIVWFTTNGMCVKNSTIVYVVQASNSKRDCDVKALPILMCEQLNMMTSVRIERLRRMITTCCRGAKLCAHAAREFWSQRNGAVTRMWRSCRVQPSHKECAIGVVCCKKEGCCCNLSGGVALIVWFTTNGMCVKNNTIILCSASKQ